jgi:hypothetical protein
MKTFFKLGETIEVEGYETVKQVAQGIQTLVEKKILEPIRIDGDVKEIANGHYLDSCVSSLDLFFRDLKTDEIYMLKGWFERDKFLSFKKLSPDL